MEKEEQQIIDFIEENLNDLEILNFSISILKLATQRLDKDLNNKEIGKEYSQLNNIIIDLEKILQNYK